MDGGVYCSGGNKHPACWAPAGSPAEPQTLLKRSPVSASRGCYLCYPRSLGNFPNILKGDFTCIFLRVSQKVETKVGERRCPPDAIRHF